MAGKQLLVKDIVKSLLKQDQDKVFYVYDTECDASCSKGITIKEDTSGNACMYIKLQF